MAAFFNFQSILTILVLLICTCAYIHSHIPSLLDKNKTGFLGLFWKAARIGERLSPYVAIFAASLGGLILINSYS